jgi:hypothetical protein
VQRCGALEAFNKKWKKIITGSNTVCPARVSPSQQFENAALPAVALSDEPGVHPAPVKIIKTENSQSATLFAIAPPSARAPP